MTGMDVAGKAPRSTFVSVVAWIFIALSGFGVLISILQNLLIGFMVSQEEFMAAFNNAEQEPMPAFMIFFIENIQLIMLLSLVLVILLLAASIGLLMRKNWARKTFIVYMFISCLYMVVGSILQGFWMNEMMGLQGFNTNNAAPSSFMELMQAMQYMVIVFNVGIGLIFGWLGWKLMRPEIKAEFAVTTYTEPGMPA